MLNWKRIAICMNPYAPDPGLLTLASELLTGPGCRIDLVVALNDIPWIASLVWPNQSEDLLESQTAEARDQLLAVAACAPREGAPVDVKVLVGRPSTDIVRFARDNEVDLLIYDLGASASREFPAESEGEAMRVLRYAPCPVWVNRVSSPRYPSSVMAAVNVEDNSDDNMRLNERLLAVAAALAEDQSGPLHILQAWNVVGDHYLTHRFDAREFEAYEAAYRSKLKDAFNAFVDSNCAGVSPEKHFESGAIEAVVSAAVTAAKVDLLVIGTVGRAGIPGHVLGNTAERILRTVECSVLAVKPEGFESPVR